MDKHFDTLIIGNGSIASATAVEINRRDPNHKVGIFAPLAREGCASLAAGYMLNVYGELEKGYLESEIGNERFEMTKKADGLWPSWIDHLNGLGGSQSLKLNFGTYVFNNASVSSLDDENFEYIVDALKADGTPYEIVNPRHIKGFRPAQDSRALRAVYIPKEGSMESARLFSTYNEFFKQAKAIETIDAYVEGISVEAGGKLKKVTSREGESFFAENVVLAAGAYSQKILDSIPEVSSQMPRVFFGTGAALHVSLNDDIPGFAFDLPEAVIRSTNRGNACGIHLVPYDKTRCYIGASNLVTRYYEPQPRIAAIHGVLDSAMEELNTDFYKANCSMIVGHRPTSADTHPLIGETSVKGLWVATGTKREGVHLSPLLSKSIAGEIFGESSMTSESFRPERKLIYSMSRDEAIEKTVHHHLSGAYQHNLKLPQTGWNGFVEDSLRENITKIYDELGIQDVGLPPEMLNMYKHGHIKYNA